jgi:hypothetical protein
MSSNSNGSIIPFHQKHKSYQQHSIGNHSNNIFQHKSTRLTRNNSKRLSYNLSLKKSSILSNPITSINSLSNNQNATNTRNAHMNIMKSPQHSAVNAYFNMIFNLNQNAKAQHATSNKTHTKTFFMQQSQRSSSYKENSSRNAMHNRNSRNQRLFNQNASAKTINQSGKTFSQTRTLFTRSVNANGNEKEMQHVMLQRGNNEIMNVMYHNNVDETKGSFNHVFHNNNKKIQEMMKHNSNNYNKGRIMIKTINGFNVVSSNRFIIMNAKNKKSKNI